MENKELAVQARSEFGKNAARRARKAGQIPAVIYAAGSEARPIYIDAGDFSSIARHLPETVTLVDDGKKLTVKVQEVQVNQLKNHYLHVDFQLVGAGN